MTSSSAMALLFRSPALLSDALAVAAIRCLAIHGRVTLGPGCRLCGWPVFHTKEGSSVMIGARARLVSRSRDTALGVSHLCIFRTLSQGASIVIGNDFRASGVSVCARESITIGDRVVIGSDSWIVDTDFHSLDPACRNSVRDASEAKSAPVRIESDVFIGGRAIILKGVRIGCGAVVGAGAVVTRDVEPFSMVAGNPARPIGMVRRTASCAEKDVR